MPQSSSAIHTINRIKAYDKLLDIVIFSNTAFSLHQLRLGQIYMKIPHSVKTIMTFDTISIILSKETVGYCD